MSTQNPVFIPGPTNIPERLRHAMNVPTMDHRAPDFVQILAPLLVDLKKIFKTETGTVITFPASGTGGWEAALTNTLSPGDRVLIACFGMFSQRWIEMCERLGLDVDLIDCAWGEGAPADEYGKRLAADTDHKIKAVLVTHNETATGVASDVAAVRKAMDTAQHPALLYVDAVSSLGSIDFRMDEWGVDLAISGSQKGFMLATGMAIVGVSQKAFAAAETAKCPRCFFDIRDMAAANAKGNFPYTPPVPLIMGLRESVAMLLEEGLDQVFARHHRLAEGVRLAVQAWGLRLCATKPEFNSDSVSAIYVPDGFDSNELVNHAYKTYGVSYGVGLGKVAGKVFRIGHLGMLTDTLMLSGLATIEMAMKDLGYSIQLGSGVAAAQEYYRKGR
ncbi:MAG TPA: serine--glyoxylate aminotransferase [Rhodospirillaceae bacterium]|nr:serine--glyoxylate aminotransferase [Rhodospirillaceae bacterium]